MDTQDLHKRIGDQYHFHHSGGDWLALWDGSVWGGVPVPEGTARQWREVIAAIRDKKEDVRHKRLAVYRKGGYVILYTPRNSTGEHDHIMLSEEEALDLADLAEGWCNRIEKGLAEVAVREASEQGEWRETTAASLWEYWCPRFGKLGVVRRIGMTYLLIVDYQCALPSPTRQKLEADGFTSIEQAQEHFRRTLSVLVPVLPPAPAPEADNAAESPAVAPPPPSQEGASR